MLEEELREDDTLAAPPASVITALRPGPGVAAPVPGAPADEAASSLDGLPLVRGVLSAQLQEPGRVAQVVALVALLSYALGRRSMRRDRDRWVRLLAAARD